MKGVEVNLLQSSPTTNSVGHVSLRKHGAGVSKKGVLRDTPTKTGAHTIIGAHEGALSTTKVHEEALTTTRARAEAPDMVVTR